MIETPLLANNDVIKRLAKLRGLINAMAPGQDAIAWYDDLIRATDEIETAIYDLMRKLGRFPEELR